VGEGGGVKLVERLSCSDFPEAECCGSCHNEEDYVVQYGGGSSGMGEVYWPNHANATKEAFVCCAVGEHLKERGWQR
jgi:hypothetical protein